MSGPGGYNNHSIESLSFADFNTRFVFNPARTRLLVLLLDELAEIECRSTAMRVLVFGSFVTEKPEPGDIDAMVSVVPRDDTFREVQTRGFPRRHPAEVDLFTYLANRFLFSPDRILDQFNHNFKNREHHINITRAVEIADIEAYRDRIRKGFRNPADGGHD